MIVSKKILFYIHLTLIRDLNSHSGLFPFCLSTLAQIDCTLILYFYHSEINQHWQRFQPPQFKLINSSYDDQCCTYKNKFINILLSQVSQNTSYQLSQIGLSNLFYYFHNSLDYTFNSIFTLVNNYNYNYIYSYIIT